MRRLNSLFAFAGTLGASRGRRDAGLLATFVAVLATALFLAIALPQLVLSALDAGARQAVANAGRQADILIAVDVGEPRSQPGLVSPETVVQLAEKIPNRLPAWMTRLYPDTYVTILSPKATIRKEDVEGGSRTSAQLGLLTPDAVDAMTLVDGSLPSTGRVGDRTEIEVLVSREAAEAASLTVGDVLEFSEAGGVAVVAVISGIVEPIDETALRWHDLPTVWSPSQSGPGAPVTLTFLTDAAGVTVAETLFADSFTGFVRIPADADAFSSALIAPVVREIGGLRIDPSAIVGDTGAKLVVRSGFDTAMLDYPDRARSAVAQMLVLIAGVLGVASAVLLLLSRLVVERRAGELSLERARGASVASIAVRSLLETIVLSATAAAVGLGAAIALWGFAAVSSPGVAPVLAVGVLGWPVQAVFLILRADRRGRRSAANRVDRMEKQRQGRSRRLVVEAFILVVALAALYAVRTRGLLQTRTDGVDPLLAAAPMLLAIAVTVVVLRVYPVVVRLAMRIGRSSRGPLGTLGAMQAERALAVLPLGAITLAISLVVTGGLLVETVRSGQADASWERTGAEARVQGEFTDADVAAVARANGVTAATGVLTIGETRAAVGAELTSVTLLAVDPSYDQVISRLPAAAGVTASSDVSALFEPTAEGESVPILVDRSLARRLTGDIILTVAGETRETVDAHVVGTFEGAEGGYARTPFIYIDRAALSKQIEFAIDADTLLVMGPGAAAAVKDVEGETFTRATWLLERNKQALVAGVNQVMLASTGAVALLALIGFVASVLAGSRSRRRSLSLLRTLGMDSRLGWWLALSELAPIVIAAVIGGVVAGVAAIVILGPSFGLETLTGGAQPPALAIAPWVIYAVAAGAVVLALVAMLVEVVAHRRDRISDVLRVGESV